MRAFVASLIAALYISGCADPPTVDTAVQSFSVSWCPQQYLVFDLIHETVYPYNTTVGRPILPTSNGRPAEPGIWQAPTQACFRSNANRYAYSVEVPVARFAAHLAEHESSAGPNHKQHWTFLNLSFPSQNGFRGTGEEVGLWWWGSSLGGWGIGQIPLSQPLPEGRTLYGGRILSGSRTVSARETLIGERSIPEYRALSVRQTVRLTYLNTPEPNTTPKSGSGWADQVSANGIWVSRDAFGCWHCVNY